MSITSTYLQQRALKSGPPAATEKMRGPRPTRHFRVLAACGVLVLASSAFSPPVEPAMTVVIDAGHGGKDPGNLGTGRYKTAEKDITLAVAHKTAAYIEERVPGVRIVMTRDGRHLSHPARSRAHCERGRSGSAPFHPLRQLRESPPQWAAPPL